MEYKRFVRWALLLPIVLPAVVGPLLFIPGMEATAAGDWIAILVWSLLFGGIPYLLFVAGFQLWMREREDARIRLALRLSPLLFAVVLVACLLPFLLPRGRDGVTGGLVFGGISLALGYAYVLVAEAAWWLIGRRHVVHPSAAAPLPAE